MNSLIECIPKNEWDSLIFSIIHKYRKLYYKDCSLSVDDLEQEAWIGLLSAAKNYDSTKETKFTTFAYQYINGRVLRCIMKSLKKSELMEEMENVPEVPIEIKHDFENKDLIAKIMKILDNDPNKDLFMKHFIDKVSYRDLAKIYSISHAGVGIKINKLLKKIEADLQDERA